jgi:hypothetical protein
METILIGNLQERDLGDLAVNGEVIVKWIFRKWDGRARTRFKWLKFHINTIVSLTPRFPKWFLLLEVQFISLIRAVSSLIRSF